MGEPALRLQGKFAGAARLVALVVVLAVPAALIPAATTLGAVQLPAKSDPLRFGIYPDAGVGTVNIPATGQIDPLPIAMRRLQQLRGDREFVIRLYTEIDGTAATAGHLVWAESELARYTALGYSVELVLRHRPVSPDPKIAVERYCAGVRQAVEALGANPGLVSLQITNEANLEGSPAAGDGAYPGSVKALSKGLVTAHRTAERLGYGRIQLGFSAADNRDLDFWRRLAHHGGRSFRSAVDWVGLDVYPGTWSAPKARKPRAIRKVVRNSLRYMRHRALPTAGLGRGVDLHVSETGFPTGPGRSAAEQAAVLKAAVQAVERQRGRLGVTDLTWFDLIDADSSSKAFEHHYGLLRDDGTPKPAFWMFAALVARFGGPR